MPAQHDAVWWMRPWWWHCVVEVQHIQVLSYKGTGRDGTVMFGSVPANVPLAEDVYFTKISDSFELQPPSRTTINCNLLMETVTIEGEVISTANKSIGCSRLFAIMRRSHDRKYWHRREVKVSVECKSEISGHGCRSRTSTYCIALRFLTSPAWWSSISWLHWHHCITVTTTTVLNLLPPKRNMEWIRSPQ